MRPCLTCGTPAEGTYCTTHEPQRPPWQRSRPRRRTEQGGGRQRRNQAVMAAHGGRCHVCGGPGADQVDHVVPVAEGGPDDESNLRPIHAEPCHRAKTADEAARGRRRRDAQPPRP